MQFIIYIPIIIIVCVNIFFFIKTALNICQQKKSIANHIKGTDSQRTDSYHKHWFVNKNPKKKNNYHCKLIKF